MEDEKQLVKIEDVHDAARSIEITPVSKIERGLSNFISDTFKMIQDEDLYKKTIQNEIVLRLHTFSNSEIIALITSQSSNQNDLISKVISPTMGLLTAAQQAEMAKQQRETQAATLNVSQTNIRDLNANTSTEVLTGMRALMNLMNVAESWNKPIEDDKPS